MTPQWPAHNVGDLTWGVRQAVCQMRPAHRVGTHCSSQLACALDEFASQVCRRRQQCACTSLVEAPQLPGRLHEFLVPLLLVPVAAHRRQCSVFSCRRAFVHAPAFCNGQSALSRTIRDLDSIKGHVKHTPNTCVKSRIPKSAHTCVNYWEVRTRT